MLSSTSPPPLACSWISLKGSSPEDISSSSSRQVTCFFGLWGLETGHASLGASPLEWLWLWGTGIWHVSPCWLPSLTSQYPFPEGGQPLMLFDGPPWLYWGPGCGGPHSLPRSGNGIQSGGWSTKYSQQLSLIFFWPGGTPPLLHLLFQGSTDFPIKGLHLLWPIWLGAW